MTFATRSKNGKIQHKNFFFVLSYSEFSYYHFGVTFFFVKLWLCLKMLKKFYGFQLGYIVQIPLISIEQTTAYRSN